jgi:energy-coupling factor transporter ATP-binding protein EcfA2
MDCAIDVQALSFTPSGRSSPVLSDINLSVDKGSFVGVMGHSGAGKSCLCSALNGIIPRFVKGDVRGTVMTAGINPLQSTVPQMSRHIGFVFQDFEAQITSTRVSLEVAFGPENHNLDREEIRRRVEKYLSLMDLRRFAERNPSSLSGGQKQRLVLASVLALETEIVVLDEPTSDLDHVSKTGVLHLSKQRSQSGYTVIVVDHEPEVFLEADEVVLMREGRIVAQDHPRRLLSKIDVLLACGVRPPQVADAFWRLQTGILPLTPLDGISHVRELGLNSPRRFSDDVHRAGSPVILEARNVCYRYENADNDALCEVNLQIRQGDFISIVGQNGSGKSTLGQILGGLLRQQQGCVFYEQQSLREGGSGTSPSIGYVFQNPDYQIVGATVEEDVGLGPRSLGLPEQSIRTCVARALEAVDLERYRLADPFGLSRGERQRVAIAGALALLPKVIILDEPTTGLDHRQQVKIMNMLTSLNQKGHTILITTHHMWIAAEYTKRTIVMKNGRIVLDQNTRSAFYNADILQEAGLVQPPIVQMAAGVNTNALSVAEFVEAMRSQNH